MTQPEDIDIVDRLRLFKYPLELEAADEIEQLRAERDHARSGTCDEIGASDMLVIYEAARLALSDDDIRSDLGEFLDLSDQHLHSILLKIERHLNQ
jgi:hypothetical protein